MDHRVPYSFGTVPMYMYVIILLYYGVVKLCRCEHACKKAVLA